jgi:hypothetical protein
MNLGGGMIKVELTNREAAFIAVILDKVQGIDALDTESRGKVRKLILSIQEKVGVGGADENSIF